MTLSFGTSYLSLFPSAFPNMYGIKLENVPVLIVILSNFI